MAHSVQEQARGSVEEERVRGYGRVRERAQSEVERHREGKKERSGEKRGKVRDTVTGEYITVTAD